ncbi:MAG TPA: type II secretion system F family protein [Terriglobia bacterium]|nr:type II secretion system F family protein [Terriglobia bacterium]
MIWVFSAITFVAGVLIVLAISSALAPGPQGTSHRLDQLWASAEKRGTRSFPDLHLELLWHILHAIGRLFPASASSATRVEGILARAGVRQAGSLSLLRGVKLVTALAFAGLLWASGRYQSNPVFLFILAAIAGFVVPDFWLTWRVRRRKHRIQTGLADALDLLIVCVEAGLALDQSILRVSQELSLAHPELSEELQLMNFEVRVGKARAEALHALAVRTGVDDVLSLVSLLIQAERFGGSIAQSLRIFSENLRTLRRQRAEELAAKTTVKMIPVLVLFIFPALFVVILGPAVLRMMQELLPALAK